MIAGVFLEYIARAIVTLYNEITVYRFHGECAFRPPLALQTRALRYIVC